MSASDIRAEARAWLDAQWRPDRDRPGPDRREWLRLVFEAGWAVPRWSVDWFGRGLTDEDAEAAEAEFSRVGAPGAGQCRTHLAGNTLMAFGDDDLKRALLPRFLTAEITSCLLYSEPGAGSDLASLRTRADADADGWSVTGQKVWTSNAMTADYGMLLARTDWDAPKHKGISFFLIPMRQPGIDIRPLRQITGDAQFSEVFLDGALVPRGHRIGKAGEGWKVLQTALGYERLVMAAGSHGPGKSNYVDLIGFARRAGVLDDPLIRQSLAGALALRQLNMLTLHRAQQEAGTDGASPLMSLGKLAMSRIVHEDARVMMAMLGPQSMLDGDDHPLAAQANYRAANAYFTSIGGGTDQIQRNIIGERILGLPREPDPDRDRPFREICHGPA